VRDEIRKFREWKDENGKQGGSGNEEIGEGEEEYESEEEIEKMRVI